MFALSLGHRASTSAADAQYQKPPAGGVTQAGTSFGELYLKKTNDGSQAPTCQARSVGQRCRSPGENLIVSCVPRQYQDFEAD